MYDNDVRTEPYKEKTLWAARTSLSRISLTRKKDIVLSIMLDIHDVHRDYTTGLVERFSHEMIRHGIDIVNDVNLDYIIGQEDNPVQG